MIYVWYVNIAFEILMWLLSGWTVDIFLIGTGQTLILTKTEHELGTTSATACSSCCYRGKTKSTPRPKSWSWVWQY